MSGDSHYGDVAFWGEWEGAARVAQELPKLETHGPRWLWEPDPRGSRPEGRPQNTDPFVWGDAIVYTACRQDQNAKLRGLGCGSVILFGSSLARTFVLDTVLVVAGYIDHNRSNFCNVLDGVASEDHMRMTLKPWYEPDLIDTFRCYVGATPENPVEGMFSFVPCTPDLGSGFARPSIELDGYITPRLAMAARTNPVSGSADVATLWRCVVDQVLAHRHLALGTHFELPV